MLQRINTAARFTYLTASLLVTLLAVHSSTLENLAFADGEEAATAPALTLDQQFQVIAQAVAQSPESNKVANRHFGTLSTPGMQTTFINSLQPGMPNAPVVLNAFARFLIRTDANPAMAAQAYRASVWCEVESAVRRAGAGATIPARGRFIYAQNANSLREAANQQMLTGAMTWPINAWEGLRNFALSCVRDADNYLTGKRRPTARGFLSKPAVSPNQFSFGEAHTPQQRLRQLLFAEFFMVYDQGRRSESMIERPLFTLSSEVERAPYEPRANLSRMAEQLLSPANGDLLVAFTDTLIESGRVSIDDVHQGLMEGSAMSLDPQVRERGQIFTDNLAFIATEMVRLSERASSISTSDRYLERYVGEGRLFRDVVSTLTSSDLRTAGSPEFDRAQAASRLAEARNWTNTHSAQRQMMGAAWEALVGSDAVIEYQAAEWDRHGHDESLQRQSGAKLEALVTTRMERLRSSWLIPSGRANDWIAQELIDPNAFEVSTGRESHRRLSRAAFGRELVRLGEQVLRTGRLSARLVK